MHKNKTCIENNAGQTVPSESSGSTELVELARNVLKEFQPHHDAICNTGASDRYVTEYDRLWHEMNALRDYMENDLHQSERGTKR
mgnify:CR=1 FL=1